MELNICVPHVFNYVNARVDLSCYKLVFLILSEDFQHNTDFLFYKFSSESFEREIALNRLNKKIPELTH